MSSERNVLPLDPKPRHYDLTVKPNFVDFSFQGQVTITLVATAEATTTVTFNTIDLQYQKVTCSNGESFTEADMKFDTHLERATVTLAKPVPQGEFTMSFTYTGTMNDKMKGFYRSKYTVDGKETYMGTTQMEAVDCRRALPCWDEPVHKATFDVTLNVPKGLNALSNMPEVSRRDDAEDASTVIVKFDTTPKMSTYLLAWTIAKFDVIERTIKKTRSGEDTLVRVFAAEGKIAQGQFALDVACKCLPLYEEFFGSDYVLPKCDLLAIPDFAAGAMENWGLITYRETTLLCDPEKSARSHTEYVALVVTHELAHQWFGNLVTMDWWKELWLNESFATWCQYWATDCLFPEWDIFSRFVSADTVRAFQLDALRTSHSVEVKELKNAHEVDEIFDAISYSKGGSILRQTVEYIGLDAFKAGLVEYLDKFKYANATTNDLWHYLGKAAGKDLNAMLDPWILQQGYPILRVKKGDAPNIMVVSQQRYLSTGMPTDEEDKTVWEVPLIVRSAGEDATETRLTLSAKEQTFEYKNASSVKVNSRQTAFCRVHYAPELLAPLQEAIQKKTIGNLDRMGIISDYAAFATSGHGTAVEALTIAKNYVNEDDYNVWSAIDGLIGEVKAMLRVMNEETLANFEKYVHALYGPAFAKVGAVPVKGEEGKVAQLRTILLGRLVSCKYPAAEKACLDMWANRDTTEIPADLRGAVYTAQVRTKGAEGVAAMKAHYEGASDAMERARALRALGACGDCDILEKEVFPYIFSEKVRSGDALYFIMSVSANPKAESLYVNVFTTQWRQVYDKFPGMLLTRFVGGIGNFFNAESAAKLRAYWATVDQKERESMDRSFQQGVEGIDINVRFVAANAQGVSQFLNE